eukprot:scaffold645_cov247-Pinguiococcus_pyrenoidosus.AAC.13
MDVKGQRKHVGEVGANHRIQRSDREIQLLVAMHRLRRDQAGGHGPGAVCEGVTLVEVLHGLAEKVFGYRRLCHVFDLDGEGADVVQIRQRRIAYIHLELLKRSRNRLEVDVSIRRRLERAVAGERHERV